MDNNKESIEQEDKAVDQASHIQNVSIELFRGEEKTELFQPKDLLKLQINGVADWKSTVVLLVDAKGENRYKARRRGKSVIFETKLQNTKRYGIWRFHIEAPMDDGTIAFIEKEFEIREKVPEPSIKIPIQITEDEKTPLKETGILLLEVPGIGQTYFKRLKEHGILFFHQLADMNLKEVKNITHASLKKVQGWLEYVLNYLGLEIQEPPAVIEKQEKEEVSIEIQPVHVITGIGPKTEQILNELGIMTVSDLAKAGVDQLQTKFSHQKSYRFINSARKLLGLNEIEPRIKEEESKFDLEKISGIGPTYKRRLLSVQIDTIEKLLNLSFEELSGILKVPTRKAKLILENAKAMSKGVEFTKEIGDELLKVPGIGPTYLQRLKASGIETIRQLREVDEEKLKEITKAPLKKVKGWISFAMEEK